jgi:hypothetical protein
MKDIQSYRAAARCSFNPGNSNPLHRRTWRRMALFVLLLGLMTSATAQSNVSVFASGLNSPRGLKFGPDGFLYVAESGPAVNALTTTPDQCDQVPAPVGPYTGGFNGRILKFSRKGTLHVVADHLPSSQTNPGSGGFVTSVADVAFAGDQLYGLLSGAGCSHGLLGTNNGILKINKNGKWKMIADLSDFVKANPVADPNPGDFEPDGSWYALVEHDGRLFATEPNHGELDEISQHGNIHRVADISASQGHVVPSSLAYHNGSFFLGNLNLFPIVPGSSNVYRVGEKGHVSIFKMGVTTALGVAFDRKGRLYVLESMTAAGFPGPNEVGAGTIVRFDKWGRQETIATGLSFPTAMTFGPDGNLYVSNFGFGAPDGAGQIVKVKVPCD